MYTSSNNKYFNTLIIDNFFKDPNHIVDYSKTLSYEKDTNNQWPGKRSRPIHEINYNLFGDVVSKVISSYYSDHTFSYECSLNFQKVSSIYKDGWIHQDSCMLSFIIYLNDKNITSSGTSFYIPKSTPICTDYYDKKCESFKDMSLIDKYSDYRLKHNSQFEKTLTVHSIFNRCVVFDARVFHKADNFNLVPDNEDRLTLAGFIHKLDITSS